MKKAPSYSQKFSIENGKPMVIAGTNYVGAVPVYQNGIKVSAGIPFVNVDKLEL